MECRAADRNPSVNRYSISFQDHLTEITHLLPEVLVKKPSRRLTGSLNNVKSVSGSRELLCASQYDSEQEESECEASNCIQPTNSNRSINSNEFQSESRSFSEGTAILKYTTDDVKDRVNHLRLCGHGNNYDECCGKTDTDSDNLDVHKDSDPGHCHRNGRPAVDRKARRRLIIASIMCLMFMIAEVIGGYLAGSLAVMTDAAHLLTDFASFMISLFALWVAARPSSKRMNFGWYRAEVIGALTSVLLIWVVTGVLVYLAIEKIINKNYEINAEIMLIISGVGVAVNIIMGCTLHSHGHSHGGGSSHSHGGDSSHSHGGGSSHSHSHDDGHAHGDGDTHSDVHQVENGQIDVQQAGTNINVRAAFIHVVGDFIQSIGVFIAALIIYFKPGWEIVDPICTFLFSCLVLLTTYAIMKDTLTVLMEGLPKGVDFNDVHKTFFAITGVVQVHNLRIWSLSMEKIALSAHVVISPGISPQDVLKQVSQIVREKYSFFEMTLQIEDLKDEMNSCAECQGPK